MSNLQAAISQAELRNPHMGIPMKTRTKLQVAKRVFTLAAAGGFPYTGMSFQAWAKKWLTSDTYRLMEIDINAAASPHLPKNPERVAFRLLCASDSMDPIVVDLNKQKTGKSHLGYIPKIVVLDGKHRKQAQMLQGHNRILAWVGCRAEKHLSNIRLIDSVDFSNVKSSLGSKVIIQASQLHVPRNGHSLETSFNLHCATVPSTGSATLDQSGGEKGSRPRDAVVQGSKGKCPHCGSKDFSLMPTDFETAKCKKCGRNFKAAGAGGPGASLGSGSGSNPMTMKGKKVHARDCDACGNNAKSMGQLEEASASDDPDNVPNASDQTSFVSPSDRRNYQFPKEQIKAPGAKGWQGYGPDSQNGQAPGSGSGPRTKRSTGATRSEMSRLADTVPAIDAADFTPKISSKGKMVRQIYTKAPPGFSEETMHKLKRKHGTPGAFKIAWSSYQNGKGEMDALGMK